MPQVIDTSHLIPLMRLCIVNAYSVRPKRCCIKVQRYEIRAYIPEAGRGAKYFRNRKNGYNPRKLASVLSGSGIPQWMNKIVEEYNEKAELARKDI